MKNLAILFLLLFSGSIVDAAFGEEGSEKEEFSFRYETRKVEQPMHTERTRHVTVPLGKGHIGIFGGFAKTSVEIFNVEKETFRQPSAKRSFGGFHGIAVGNGRALLVDGRRDCEFDLSTEDFVPTENTFGEGRAHQPRMVPLPNGNIFLCGGMDANLELLGTCAVYDRKTRRFTTVGKLTQPRTNFTANRIADDKILITGGYDKPSKSSLNTLEIFDLATNTSTLLPNLLVEPKYGHAGVVLSDGSVLLAGGYNARGSRQLRSAEVYDPRTGKVTSVSPLGMTRHEAKTALLPSGRVAFYGGRDDARAVEIYDPVERKFLLADQMLVDPRRGRFTTTRLENGSILIVGGRVNSTPEKLRTAEIFTESKAPAKSTPSTDISPLVQQLNDDNFHVRESATKKLIAMGANITEDIRLLLEHSEPEVQHRARTILKALPESKGPTWAVEIWRDEQKQETLHFKDYDCPMFRHPKDPRILDLAESVKKHRPTHLVVRFPVRTPYEQQVALFNLVGWTRFPKVYLGESR